MTIKELGPNFTPEWRTDLNNNFKELAGMQGSVNDAVNKAKTAEQIANDAKTTANSANNTSNSVQKQLDTIVINGDSSVEAAQARVDENGKTSGTLKERIDKGFVKLTDKQSMDIKHYQQKLRTENKAKLSTFSFPTDFTWKAPIQIFTDGRSYETFFDVARFKNTGGTTYYIKYDTGLNANNGTSENTPFQTLGKALSVAVDGDTIVILDTLLSRANFGVSNISVTKNINIIAKTRCVIKAGDTHTFTKTSGYTNIWDTNRTNALRVVDYEKEYDFTKMNSITECDATPGSWYTDGTKVYIHTLESTSPIDSKHFVLINTNSFVFVDSTVRNVKLYLENVEIVGGVPQIETKNSATTKSYVYIKNSKLLYNCSTLQGSIYAAGCEHAFFQNVTCAYSWEDGFDYQPLNGTATKFIEVDCIGHSNGRYNQAADNFNGSTAHQDCKGVRYGGYYYKNIGPQVVDIYGTIQSVNFNVAAFDSEATQIPKIGFEIMDNQMWLFNCTSFGNDIDIYAPTGSMYVDVNSVYYTKGGSGILAPG
ncbi:hypothetical protein [Bacillus wiedmannii]|uniref:hypothetical protein n=1 Tax=Bacillus wiedmannii TaxID=1890302 RepID=UPI0015D4A0EF|nr:hypothetical protein [Bacillus wiedmannii]